MSSKLSNIVRSKQ